MQQKYKNTKGFTLIELLIIIAIIGLLATVVLVSLNIARDKAAVASYKTSMKAVRTGLELCWVGGGNLVSGNAGVQMCNKQSEDAKYPELSSKCGAAPNFDVRELSPGAWSMTTVQSGGGITPWDCRGCRVECTVNGCVYHETKPGDCK